MYKFIYNFFKKNIVHQSIKRQLSSSLLDLSLWDIYLNEKKHLSINHIDTLELVSCYGSPLLVVNQAKLFNDAISIQRAVKKN